MVLFEIASKSGPLKPGGKLELQAAPQNAFQVKSLCLLPVNDDGFESPSNHGLYVTTLYIGNQLQLVGRLPAWFFDRPAAVFDFPPAGPNASITITVENRGELTFAGVRAIMLGHPPDRG